MTGLWIAIGLGTLALVGYVVLSLRKLSTPTKGAAIDRAVRPETALVVIDVQEDFTRSTGKHAFDPEKRDAALAAISREIEACRAAGHRIAFIRNIFQDWPVILAMKLVGGGVGTPGREGLKLDRTLDVQNAPEFVKSIGDTFSNPDFETWLADKRVGRLILVGLDTCHCVQLTARGALARGYEVEIREPATLTTTPDKWSAMRQDLATAGAALA
ncbi:cysteine hydrolase family protein [Roseibium sediminicola]|uniref:Cysteine hydrolase n=1 Tax=Roseibium sediminicola TaxID=2933272 RepID=A0ABT0GPH2_9HYPH|nr:cysteine hydrolase [Roseibium sp. CAU 1639]MCK7610753.1 cysteine hydrolase [Roseibium sp. CAU 1639]